ncbi:MAG TPA: hypothetical protein VGO26_05310 [Amnibacterium sp.]|nr:hypothetical protein [Amnibacterium sp.]
MFSEDDERARIRAVLTAVTERYGVVLDDIVLRTWDNRSVDLTFGMLASALAASDAAPEDDADLWAVARAVSHGEALRPLVRRAG